MSRMENDRGIDLGDQADKSRDLEFEASRRRAMAPMDYQIAFVLNGEIVIRDFACAAPDRMQVMREEFGIDPENDRIARRCKPQTYNAKWTTAIGDAELCEKLDNS